MENDIEMLKNEIMKLYEIIKVQNVCILDLKERLEALEMHVKML